MALTPFKSNLIADVGVSMGDEGKGRLIPEIVRELQKLTGRREVVGTVLKVNGGANSGHTVAGLKLNLLPGGVAEHDVACLALGSGVVADPRKALWEALPVEQKGFPVLSRLLIDERCMVSDVSHRILDLAWEDYRVNVLGHEPRGSTGRGITPAYADEVGQFQTHYAEFLATSENYAIGLEARLRRAASIVQHVCRLAPEKWAQLFQKLTDAELRANQGAITAGIFSAQEFDFTRYAGPTPFTFTGKPANNYATASAMSVSASSEISLPTVASSANSAKPSGSISVPALPPTSRRRTPTRPNFSNPPAFRFKPSIP